MTIYDISKKAGVSIATVSRVLNGSSSVSEKTKKKVLAVMEQYNYKPNAFARGLGLDTMQTIGILCADSSDAYLAKAVYFLEQNLRAHDYDCILCCTGYDLEIKKKYINLLLSKRVDSIILVGSNFIEADNSRNQYIIDAAKQVPIMLLNADFDNENVYCTLCDDFKSTFEATNTLIASGRRDVLYLYNSNSYSGLKKLSGYQMALTKNDIPIRKDFLQFYPGRRDDISGVTEFLNNLYNTGISFNGVIASNDNLAIGAIKYAKSHGLSVPEDVSVIGYDNSLMARCCEPELTSVDNRLELLCEHLINTLMGVLNGEQKPQKVIFSGELVKRGTTLFK